LKSVGGLLHVLTVDVDRVLEPVLHRAVHGGDAAQDVQSRPAGLPHVAVQSFRLFRRAVQYRRSDLQLQRRHAGARCQRPAMRPAAACIQGYTVHYRTADTLSLKKTFIT